MIKGPGPVTSEYDALLNRLAIGAQVESTESGFEYQVFDPERLPWGNDLILGTVLNKPDEVEVELFMSGALPVDVRPAIATICAQSSAFDDRYTLVRTSEETLGFSADDLDDETRAHNSRVIDHIMENMRLHRLGIQKDRDNRQNVDPNLLATLHSTLGWVAFRRDLTPLGAETVERLAKDGLVIPDFDSEQRVVGLMTTDRGTVRGGFMTMAEKDERHTCPCCSGQILKGSDRITLQIDDRNAQRDHHHYHQTCFADEVLPRFNPNTLAIAPNPHALGR